MLIEIEDNKKKQERKRFMEIERKTVIKNGRSKERSRRKRRNKEEDLRRKRGMKSCETTKGLHEK